MYQATITRQRQMSIPAKLMELVGFLPGSKVNLSVSETKNSRVIVVKHPLGWDSLAGILKKHTKIRRYPNKEEIATAWAAGYKEKWLKNEKGPR